MSRQGVLTVLRKLVILNQFTAIIIVFLVLTVVSALVYYSQALVEREIPPPTSLSDPKQYETEKLYAEIRQIRSDTSGSLFWLKMIALFVTVGGAVGGYLLGQSQNTRKRLDFEHKKSVNAAYQAIVQELSDKSPILRATAAVKLGAILKSFPKEWDVEDIEKEQMVNLTKRVLAASLAIEKDPKVLKTLTISLVLHERWQGDPRIDWLSPNEWKKYHDARGLDLSGVKAEDAYWARVDFSTTDFYKAKLVRASLRRSILDGAQFYYTDLSKAVLVEARGSDANFKFADLRGADLSDARFVNPNFEGAKVYGAKLVGMNVKNVGTAQVDNSPEGDGSQLLTSQEWLTQMGVSQS